LESINDACSKPNLKSKLKIGLYPLYEFSAFFVFFVVKPNLPSKTKSGGFKHREHLGLYKGNRENKSAKDRLFLSE